MSQPGMLLEEPGIPLNVLQRTIGFPFLFSYFTIPVSCERIMNRFHLSECILHVVISEMQQIRRTRTSIFQVASLYVNNVKLCSEFFAEPLPVPNL